MYVVTLKEIYGHLSGLCFAVSVWDDVGGPTGATTQ